MRRALIAIFLSFASIFFTLEVKASVLQVNFDAVVSWANIDSAGVDSIMVEGNKISVGDSLTGSFWYDTDLGIKQPLSRSDYSTYSYYNGGAGLSISVSGFQTKVDLWPIPIEFLITPASSNDEFRIGGWTSSGVYIFTGLSASSGLGFQTTDMQLLTDPTVFSRFAGGFVNGPSVWDFYYKINAESLTFNIVNPVPEPATVLFLCAGLIGLAGYGRKRIQR